MLFGILIPLLYAYSRNFGVKNVHNLKKISITYDHFVPLVLEVCYTLHIGYNRPTDPHRDLLAYQHFARGGKFPSFECIEIDTAGDRLTEFIFAIPIRRTTFALIDTYRLIP